MKIGVLVPNKEMEELSIDIGTKMGYEVFCAEVITNDPVMYARSLIRKHNIDAIIARNPTSYFLESKLDIPVVTLHITRFDLFRSIENVSKGKKIGFVYMPQDKEKYNYHYDSFKKRNIRLAQSRRKA